MKKINVVFLIVIAFVAVGLFTYYKNNNGNYLNNSTEYGYVDATGTPKLIEPFYSTNHFVVADYIINPKDGDMTGTIQDTLFQCGNAGGGTVWLERGIYLVSKTIAVPASCTLMGDWQDPDNYQGTLDYGTKIVVDVNNFASDTGNNETSGLFRLHADGTFIIFGFKETISFADVTSQTELEYSTLYSSHHFCNNLC